MVLGSLVWEEIKKKVLLLVCVVWFFFVFVKFWGFYYLLIDYGFKNLYYRMIYE